MADYMLDFSTEEDVQSEEAGGGNYWPRRAQMAENVTLATAEIVIDKWQDTAIMDLFWADKDGRLLKHRLWGLQAPTEQTDDALQAFEKSKKSFQKNIKHILTKYMTDENYQKVRATLKGTMEQIFTRVKDILVKVKAGDTPVRLKVVLNADDFPKVPSYVPYVELMTVPTAETKLKFTDFDKTVRSSAGAEASQESVLNAAGGGEESDDLPF